MLTKTMNAIVGGIQAELEINADEIEEAMARNDGEVTISCSIRIEGQPHVTGAKNKVNATMSWVKEKRKVVIKKTVNEGQTEIDFKKRAAGDRT